MTILVFKNVYLFTIDTKFMFGLHKIYITNSQNREYFNLNIFLNLQARRCCVPQQNLFRHLFFLLKLIMALTKSLMLKC